MEKEKRKEIIKKYDYMRELSLEGFIWEFIRRNKEYKNAYNKYEDNKSFWDEVVYEPPIRKNQSLEKWDGRAFNRSRLLFEPFGLQSPLNPSRQADDESFKHLPIRLFFLSTTKPVFFCDVPWEIKKRFNYGGQYFLKEWEASRPYNIKVHIDLTVSIEKLFATS